MYVGGARFAGRQVDSQFNYACAKGKDPARDQFTVCVCVWETIMSHEVESESSEHERQSDEEAEPKGKPRD